MPTEHDVKNIQDAIRSRYAGVSVSAEGKFNYPTGKAGALMLGYDPAIVESMPEELVASFCGVGNPFSLGHINSGESILDIGCGAGFDLVVASRLTGPSGNICGIDLTPAMAEKALRNLKQAGVPRYDIRIAGAESIPYDNATFDRIISNGVLNLSPLKEQSFRELFRVLKPGGRLQFADIILREGAAPACSTTLEAWSN